MEKQELQTVINQKVFDLLKLLQEKTNLQAEVLDRLICAVTELEIKIMKLERRNEK